jgi:hypothetical protein
MVNSLFGKDTTTKTKNLNSSNQGGKMYSIVSCSDMNIISVRYYSHQDGENIYSLFNNKYQGQLW